MNALYDKGRDAFANGDVDWVNDPISVVLVDTGNYTADLANHQFLASIPGAARTASASLSAKTTTAGIVDAADSVFSTVSGAVSEALVIYRDTGNEADSALLAYYDTATGLPVTPNGGDITVTWDNGINKVFKL